MTAMPGVGLGPSELEREAADHLAQALGRAGRLHEPGVRDEHRAQLGVAIERARKAIAAAAEGSAVVPCARGTLLEALAARAEDARYGAGQLSRGSQRAPTVADCEDGWQRVEQIVRTAEAAAKEAREVARALGTAQAERLAARAEAAAQAARAIVEDRNHAYTFHADPGFSFGEGYYLAAAAVLSDVAIQIEPGAPQTAQAQRFLRDAGLDDRCVPYRSRPRANKHLPEIVARAFHADPAEAQRRVRAAFLGEGPLSPEVVRWADQGLADAPAKAKVLLWVRYARHQSDRNTTHEELCELARRVQAADLVPVLVGDALREGPPPPGAVDWTLFWKQGLFQGEDMRRAQLHLFEHLRYAHRLVGQVGVTTAGADGPALIGVPTMYLTAEPNARLGLWVGAVPGYEEIVRKPGYLERIDEGLRRWARLDPSRLPGLIDSPLA